MPNPLRLGLALLLTTSACSAGLHLGASSGASSGASAGAASQSAGGDNTGGGGDGSVAAGGGNLGNGGASSAPSAGAVKPGVPVTKLSDFAFEVHDATGDFYAAWVIDKLTTFKVAPACYEKMTEKNGGAVTAATHYTRAVGRMAKTLTGDDWGYIEHNGNDRERNKKLVEPMIDQFKASYGMTIMIDGDDCESKLHSLWMKYWTEIGTLVEKNPPASGKVFINLNVVGSARDVTVNYDDSSSTYTITAPRDIEKPGWDEKMEKPFRKHAREH